METGQLAVSQRSQNTTVNQEQRMKTEQKEAVEKFYDSEERGKIVSLLNCRYNYDILYILQPVPKSCINIYYALWWERS